MTRKIFSSIPLFVEVAKWKSFSKAAKNLGIPLPTVSRNIADLERELGLQLFQRTKRKVELTETGTRLFERCECIVSEARMAVENLLNDHNKVAGHVRLALPSFIYYTYLQGALGAFATKYPEIDLHIVFIERPVDLYTEPYDLELQMEKFIPDASLIVKELYCPVAGIYASPEFMKTRPNPKTPQDIAPFPFILPHFIYPSRKITLFRKGKKAEVAIQPKHIASDVVLALDLVQAGRGVSILGIDRVSLLEKQGKLLRLLPDWTFYTIPIRLARLKGNYPYRIKLFSDFLEKWFAALKTN